MRDTTAPTVSLTAPTAGATVSGTVTISANASDNKGVTKVEFCWTARSWGRGHHRDLGSYSVSWNTTTVANGSHTLTARAYDAAGNTKTSTAVGVTVNKPTPPHPR